MSLQAKYESLTVDSDLVCYLPEHIPSIWADVHPLIKQALDRGSDYNRTDVFYGLLDSSMQLWTSHKDGKIEAALVTKLEDGYCLLLACGGGNMSEWGKYFTILEEWARTHGCKELVIWGRVGWARAFGFEIQLAKMVRKL